MIQQSDGHYLKWEKYASGQLKSKQNFIQLKNGTYVADGFYVRYFENGIVADSAFFLNGKKNGIERTYYETGKLASSFFYRDGQPDSLGIMLHPNGKLAFWFYRIFGKPWGKQEQYDMNGNLMSVIFATGLDSMAFIAKMDKEGTITKMEGNLIYALERDHANLKVGYPFSVLNFVPEFGKYKARLIVMLKDSSLRTIEERNVRQLKNYKYDMSGSAYFFDYVFKVPGPYTYCSIVTLYDTTNQKVLRIDTVQTILKVPK